jgi:uncharacterized protein Usg
VITGFSDYWDREIKAYIDSVRLANTELVGAGEMIYVDWRINLH